MGEEEMFLLRPWLTFLVQNLKLGRQARDVGESGYCSFCLKVICRQKSLPWERAVFP